MNNQNYLNIHVLISHSPSCLNRDDMNMQKSAVFGGVRRVRVSSQSLKRAMRKSSYYAEHLGENSVRTRDLDGIIDHITKALENRFDQETVRECVSMIAGQTKSGKHSVAPWAVSEIASYCHRLQELKANEVDQDRINKQLEKESNMFRESFAQSKDIAFSGRMATSGIMTSVDASLAVAHAMTTHAVDADIDWFTAVDDLIEEDSDESGAGHLETQEFSSGVFYRYASLNLKQLQMNLGLIQGIDGDETNESRKEALSIGRHAVHLLATITPNAKQNSFAAHNLADLVFVTFSNLPVSLANAFEKPVEKDRNGGFLTPSISALESYWNKVHTGYGLDERMANFCLSVCEMGESKPTLPELENWITTDGSSK